MYRLICTSKDDIGANTKFVNDSATAILAPTPASSNPLIGCSPIEVAIPTLKFQVRYNFTDYKLYQIYFIILPYQIMKQQ